MLADSLAANSEAHPIGSIGVRELYSDNLIDLGGDNIAVKLEDGAEDASDWLFVELYELEPGGQPTVQERGASVCLACHVPAADFVRSTWPLP